MLLKYLTLFFHLFIISCIPLSAQEPPWTTRIEIPHSTIKDQGRSASCWAYAAVSFLESEQLRISGTYTPLSPMFFVYNVYKDKAQTYLFRQGKSAFEGGGMAHDVFRSLEKNGAIPAEI